MSQTLPEGTRLASMLRSTQNLFAEVNGGNKSMNSALASQLSELIREIEFKLQSKECPDEVKLGILFAFMAWHHIEGEVSTNSQITKFFEQKASLLFLKSSKITAEVITQAQECPIKTLEVISWITLPQPGASGTMTLTKSKSFVKKVDLRGVSLLGQ